MMSKQQSIICSIWVLLALFVMVQGCTPKNPHIAKADGFLTNKDFDSAVEYYTKALKQDPDNLKLQMRLRYTKQQASIAHMQTAKGLMDKKFFRQAIEELQVAVAFYPSNHRAIELIGMAKTMKEAAYYSKKGKQLLQIGDMKNAKLSFQRSLELDKNNAEARSALARFSKMPDETPLFPLDFRKNTPVSLKFKKTPVLNVFEILSKLSGINFIFDKDVKETKVTLFMTDVRIDRFLDALLRTHSLSAKVINSKTLLIYPDTSQKAKEYDQLYVKTFYLSYLDAKSAVSILTKILKNKNIIANEKLNAVTVRGKKEKVDMAAKILAANDRTPSEVVLNVEIMEVQRSKEKDLGLSISDTITFGASEAQSGITFDSDFGFSTMASIKDISSISSRELYLSLPTATLKLLKQDDDTKILAKPQLRVSSSEKATILIGEKVPLRTNRRTQTDGSTTYDFQYQDVGVKLSAEPVINMFDQVTLKLNIEISSLGSNVGTVNDPQYSIKTRTTETVLTIQDGDSVIIGGLIEDEDRATIQRIPMLGEIPSVGKLFSNTNAEVINTDILMAITPVIIRNQDIPKSDVSGFWSGSEARTSLKPPPESSLEREKALKENPGEDYMMVVRETEFLPSDSFYSIQVFSSKDEKESEDAAKKFEAMGYKIWVRPSEVKNKGTYFRVYAGQYESYQLAEKARLKMVESKKFRKDIHIVDRAYVYGQ